MLSVRHLSFVFREINLSKQRKGVKHEKLKSIIYTRKNGSEQAIEELILRFQPLMNKMAWKSGEYDEDCYQECMLAFVIAIGKFEIR